MDKKIKVLWMGAGYFTDKKPDATGTWSHSMANELVKSGEIELYNITQSSVKSTLREDFSSITQWVIPSSKLNRSGLPSKSIIRDIVKITAEVKPDIIHIWGVESFWGLLKARNLISGKVILEIQGLKSEIHKYFYTALTYKDIIASFGLRELIKSSDSIICQKRSFKRWGKFEKEIIRNHFFITTQSDWVRSHIRNINKDAKLYETKMLLREEFKNAEKWNYDSCIPYSLFTTFSSIVSYKGLHVLIDAIAILKKDFPSIKLNIAGSTGRQGILGYGYYNWIKKRINKLGIKDSVNWLGPLKADEIVKNLRDANVNVIPSFVESYCMALDEAIHVGTPTVASFAGAMPELGKHKETVYYFQSGDPIMCADAIASFFKNRAFSENVSENAYKSRSANSDKCSLQLEIYRDVLNK